MYKGHSIGVVIPTKNEENHIKDTVETLPDFVDKIYVVDDGSTRSLRRLQISEFI
jgi:glycosyltransferase involved in cell wall biosynthesis